MAQSNRNVQISPVCKNHSAIGRNQRRAGFGIKIETNTEYVPAYLDEIIDRYTKIQNIDENHFVHGRDHHKTPQQRHFERLQEYKNKLSEYVEKHYMCNDQLLPAYNVQFSVADVNHYRSDMDCFVSLIEQFHKIYGFYLK